MSTVQSEDLSGAGRVAVVLMQLDTERAAAVMQQFSEDEAERIAAEIMRLQTVDAQQAEGALDAFHRLTTSGRRSARGGHEVAAGLLEASFGAERAAGLMDRATSASGGRSFEFLENAESGHLHALLDGELPQTIALVLAHLKPAQSSAVLAELDDAQRVDVAQCIATMGTATPEAVAVVADSIRQRVGAVSTTREPVEVVGGVQPLVDIINRADVATEKALMEALEQRDPALAEEVRSRMISFEDIVKLPARDVQSVLRTIDAAVLALALRKANPTVTETIRNNISERTRELVDDEMNMAGRVRMSQVEEARAEIVRSIRQLEADGEISLARAAEEDDYVD